MVYETITIKKLKEKNSFLPDELSLKKGKNLTNTEFTPKVVIGIRRVEALIICLTRPICSVFKNEGKRIIELMKPRTTPK